MDILSCDKFKNGELEYVKKTYSDGHVVIEQITTPLTPDKIRESDPIDTEIVLCEILSVAEYNSCLLELSMS